MILATGGSEGNDMRPKEPGDEAARLDALARYDVLDTPAEADLDAITGLAAKICDVPIALISLVDRSRQWFKSRVGFEWLETPRETSFCAHTILSSKTMVVEDTLRDDRFSTNPMVTGGARIRFYAGAPLLTPDGFALGALCVKDTVPRRLNPTQLEALRVLSMQAMIQIELRKQKRGLEVSQERLRIVTENASIGLVILDRQRRYTFANPAYVNILGIPKKDIMGMHVIDVLPDVYESQIRPRLDRAFLGESVSYELRRPSADGELCYVVRYEPTFVGDVVSLVVVVITDATDQFRAQDASRRLAAIVEFSDDAIIGKNLDSIVTSWNTGAERIFGYSAVEMIGSSILKIIPEDRRDEETIFIESVRRGQSITHFDTVRLTKGGEHIHVSVTTSPIKDSTGVIVGVSKIARDITESMKSEEARRASDLRYRTLFEHAPDGIIVSDKTSRHIDVNESACRMLGYSRDELIRLNAFDIVAVSDVPVIATTLEAINAGDPHHREWMLRRKDGTQFPAEVIGTSMPDGNVLGMIRDITDRKRAEARFRRLFDSNVQGVLFWRADGQVMDANDAYLATVGYTRDDVLSGRVNHNVMTPSEYSQLDAAARSEIEVRGYSTPYEKEYLRKDGSRVPVLVGAASFDDNPSEGMCFVLDLTERKKIERQFLRAQRMESIGTLAGGIAHDLNNLLAPITLGVELLRFENKDPRSLSVIDTIERSAHRGVNLVKQVLSFARGAEGNRVPVHIGTVMGEVKDMADCTFPKNVVLEMAIPKDLWLVMADPTQLNQVVLNLCVNARDAMPDGGRLELTARNIEIDQQFAVMNRGISPGRYVILQVTDTGLGIPREIIDRIFEPFFTTKEIGKGTGLGLSTVMGIARAHGGSVNVYSEPGKGTTFKIYLPAQPLSAATSPDPTTAELPRGNGELVMVVDDEASVVAITKQTLEAFGYRTVVAEDGAQAIALYAMQRDQISIILTDMMMPIMDGPALISAIFRINPRAVIVAASGLNANGNQTRGNDQRVRHFLPKPYSADTLLKLLKIALAGN
jgi:PAS domain S-box-containing protein